MGFDIIVRRLVIAAFVLVGVINYIIQVRFNNISQEDLPLFLTLTTIGVILSSVVIWFIDIEPFLHSLGKRSSVTKTLQHIHQAVIHKQSNTNASETRVLLFLLRRNQRELYLYDYFGNVSDREKKLRWRKYEGVIGRVMWKTGELTDVNLSIEHDRLWDIYNMPPNQISATNDLESILVVPIPEESNSQCLMGVLSVDSTLKIDLSGLGDDYIKRLVASMAENLAEEINKRLSKSIERPPKRSKPSEQDD